MKVRKTLSNWLTERYLLIIRNEENFAEKRSVSYTYAKVILISVAIFSVLMLASLFLTKTILAQWFDPRHAQLESSKKLIELSFRLDSLETEVSHKQAFIENFQGILAGQTDTSYLEQLKTEEGAFIPDFSQGAAVSAVDSQFRQEFEGSDLGLLNLNRGGSSELQFLFSPISGFVSEKYNMAENHFGVDVVAKRNESVKCIANGTVILSSWTQDSGYVLIIQHSENLISIYKHNAWLYEKVGNFVSGGQVVAIIGNTGELTDGPHLHFELWYNGNPVNPEDFVSF